MLSWLLESVGATSEPPAWSEVSLSIYEMPVQSKLHSLTRSAGLGNAHHIGVAVFWLEWSFGWCSKGSGVYMVHIGENSLGIFKESVPLGRTRCSPREVISILQELRSTWPGTSYHLLRRSCAHFSVELARRLDVQKPPEWLSSLASVGEHVIRRIGPTAAERAVAAATPPLERRLPPEMADLGIDSDAVPRSESEEREHTWEKACAYILQRAEAVDKGLPWEELAVELRWDMEDPDTALGDAANLACCSQLRDVASYAAAHALGMDVESIEYLGARVAPPCRLRLRLRVQCAAARVTPQDFARAFRKQLLHEFAGRRLPVPAGELQVVVQQGQVPLCEGRAGHAGGLDSRLSRLGQQPFGTPRSMRNTQAGPMVMTSDGPSAAVLLPGRGSRR